MKKNAIETVYYSFPKGTKCADCGVVARLANGLRANALLEISQRLKIASPSLEFTCKGGLMSAHFVENGKIVIDQTPVVCPPQRSRPPEKSSKRTRKKI